MRVGWARVAGRGCAGLSGVWWSGKRASVKCLAQARLEPGTSNIRVPGNKFSVSETPVCSRCCAVHEGTRNHLRRTYSRSGIVPSRAARLPAASRSMSAFKASRSSAVRSDKPLYSRAFRTNSSSRNTVALICPPEETNYHHSDDKCGDKPEANGRGEGARTLLAAQGNHWIQQRRFAGGKIIGEQSHGSECQANGH